jgi:hypothetical protein
LGFLVAKDLRAMIATNRRTMLPISSAMNCGSFFVVVVEGASVEYDDYVFN